MNGTWESIKKGLGIDCTDKEVEKELRKIDKHTKSVRDSAIQLNDALRQSQTYKIGKGMGIITNQ